MPEENGEIVKKTIILSSLGCGPSLTILVIMIFVIIFLGARFTPLEASTNYMDDNEVNSKYGEKKTEDWAGFSEDNPEKATFYKKLATMAKDYDEKYSIKLDIPLIAAIVFYNNNIDPGNEAFECNEEIIEDEDGNKTKGDCVSDSSAGKISATELYKDAKKIVEAMVKDDSLVSEEEFKTWLQEEYLEKKLSNADVEIPKKEEEKQGFFQEITEEIYELKYLYVELTYGEESSSSFDSCLGDSVDVKNFMNMQPAQYIEIMGPLAQLDYSKTGVLASVTLAQSMIESGWGKSGLTQQARNFFGIKTGTVFPNGGWDGTSKITLPTEEYVNGQYIKVEADWRKYKTLYDSIKDHSALLVSGSPYRDKVITQTTYKGQAEALHKAGYATSPDYVNSIVKQIQDFNLDKWDVKGTGSVENSCSSGSWPIRSVAPTTGDVAFNYLGRANVGQCVWYAQGRAIEIVFKLRDTGQLDKEKANKIVQSLGNIWADGTNWYSKAKGKFKTSDDPKKFKAGAIISFGGGVHFASCPASGCGHVSVIESVTDEKVIITEGASTIGDSCPFTWNCIGFHKREYSRKDFAKLVENGLLDPTLRFNGYIYFLEPES